MKRALWIGAVAGAVGIGAVAVIAWNPENSSSSAVSRPTSHITQPPTCTGRDLDIHAALKLGRTGKHVLVSFGVAGRADQYCELRGKGIPISVHIYDEHGPVHVDSANLESPAMVIAPQPGEASYLPGETESMIENPTARAWCASGGHHYTILVTAPLAHAASASATLCPSG